MSKTQQIFKKFYPDYLEKFGDRMPHFHKKVAEDILNCQSGHFGKAEINCGDCHHTHEVMLGCGNRHCGGCQKSKGDEWAEKQKEKLLPGVPYFMVTMTAPQEAHTCFRSHQHFCYDAFFKAGSQTIATMLRNQKNLGVENIGFLGVMHPGGRQMNYHPHIHFIVPNGGITKDLSEWKNGRQDYLFNVTAATKLFRGKIMDELRNLIPSYPELESYRNKGWHVDVRQMGNGEKSLNYLSRYLFKSVIAESNIVSWNKDIVTIKYKVKGSNKKKPLRLTGEEFIRRFLQLVLPKGFRKVRHYGLLSSRPKKNIPQVKELILSYFTNLLTAKPNIKEEEAPTCNECGSSKVSIVFTRPKREFVNMRK